MKVLFFIQDADAPGPRFRVMQCLQELRGLGVHADLCVCTPPYYSEPKWFRNSLGFHARNAMKICSYMRGALKAERYDVVFVQREMMPYANAVWLEEYLGRRKRPALVFDFDDSIHLHYSNPHSPSGKLPRILKASTLVIAGNNTLAQYASQYQANVRILPTPVLLLPNEAAERKVAASRNRKPTEKFTIGWSGTRGHLPYVRSLEPVLADIMQRYPQVCVHLMGTFLSDELPLFPFEHHYTPWSAQVEQATFALFDCGLMPLPDDQWTRGKCSLKLLQYGAAGMPCIGSPVGMNSEVIDHGKNGFLATTPEQWTEALEFLITQPAAAADMAQAALAQVREKYSVQACTPQLVQILEEAVRLKHPN